MTGIRKKTIKELDEQVEKFKKHYQKSNQRFNKYGITRKEYNQIFEKQNGCCKICGKHYSELKRTLCIDHCHKTGKIRGLICDKCNLGLHFIENYQWAQKANEYLKNTLLFEQKQRMDIW